MSSSFSLLPQVLLSFQRLYFLIQGCWRKSKIEIRSRGFFLSNCSMASRHSTLTLGRGYFYSMGSEAAEMSYIMVCPRFMLLTDGRTPAVFFPIIGPRNESYFSLTSNLFLSLFCRSLVGFAYEEAAFFAMI